MTFGGHCPAFWTDKVGPASRFTTDSPVVLLPWHGWLYSLAVFQYGLDGLELSDLDVFPHIDSLFDSGISFA